MSQISGNAIKNNSLAHRPTNGSTTISTTSSKSNTDIPPTVLDTVKKKKIYDTDKTYSTYIRPHDNTNKVDNNANFAAMTAKENTPNREQAIISILLTVYDKKSM